MNGLKTKKKKMQIVTFLSNDNFKTKCVSACLMGSRENINSTNFRSIKSFFCGEDFSVNYIRAKEGVWGAEFVLVTKHFIACV